MLKPAIAAVHQLKCWIISHFILISKISDFHTSNNSYFYDLRVLFVQISKSFCHTSHLNFGETKSAWSVLTKRTGCVRCISYPKFQLILVGKPSTLNSWDTINSWNFLKHWLIQDEFQFITARKRSLGQGNIFRSMCQEFCPQSVGACSGWGVLLPGGCLLQGGACSRGGWSSWGVPAPGGVCVETPVTATATGGTRPTGMHSCWTWIWRHLMVSNKNGFVRAS